MIVWLNEDTMMKTEHVKHPYAIGPNGEKRPRSKTAQAVHVMEILTGNREEEYVDDAALRDKKRRQTRSTKAQV